MDMSLGQKSLLMGKVFLILGAILSAFMLCSPTYAQPQTFEQIVDMSEENMLEITVGDVTLQAEFAESKAAEALKQQLAQGQIKVSVSPYGGFEIVGKLPQDLPQSDQRLTTTAGDIMLYQGNYIVLFYGSNSWAYTRLAHIQGQSQAQLSKILSGAQEITLKLK